MFLRMGCRTWRHMRTGQPSCDQLQLSGPAPTRQHVCPLPCLPPACLQGTLFPMCGMNLAFERTLIGPAMYFGMMGEGQPWGRYDGECIH